jgi:hypothetical protein
MKPLLIVFRRARFLILVLGVLPLAIAAFGLWNSSAVPKDSPADMKRQFHARIRDGLGREVKFASPDDPPGAVHASVNSVDNFIFRRSGVKLSGPTKNRLAEMEQRTLAGTTRRISAAELGDLLAATAFERISRLSDEEILSADNSLRGFNAPDLPQRYRSRKAIHLPGELIFISTERFVSQVKAMRDQAVSPLGEVFRGAGRSIVHDHTKKRASLFSEAVPEQFGAVSSTTQSGGGFTPLQAVLIAYSLGSGDMLCDSEANLNKELKGLQSGFTRISGENYPSPAGHFAYGVNGYINSSPLDLIFDERTVTRLLDNIEERSAS